MKTFLEPLQELEEMRLLREALTKNKKIYDVSGCIDVQKAHLIYGIGEGSPFRLIVTFDEMKAKQLLEEYRFFDPDTVYYPAKDLLFYQSDIRGNALTRQRMEAVRAVLERPEVTVITTIDALMNRIPSREKYMEGIFSVSVGDVLDLEEIRSRLLKLGYEYTSQVEHGGEFALRGGILDIFPLTEENPVRIELIPCASLTRRVRSLWTMRIPSRSIRLWSWCWTSGKWRRAWRPWRRTGRLSMKSFAGR